MNFAFKSYGLLFTLFCLSLSSSVQASEPTLESPKAENAFKTTHGFVSRLLFDAAAARLRYQYAASYEGQGDGTALYVSRKRTTNAPALGARLELGYALTKSPHFTFFPRGGLSFSRILESEIQLEGPEKLLILNPRRVQGAVTVGVESQLLQRSLGLAIDFGLAWSHYSLGQSSSPRLQVDNQTAVGGIVRGSALWRFPRATRWGGGLLGFAEASAFPGGYYSGLVWTSRVGAALFIEWDGGREQ